ncbi:Oidioi.mRNA.OKI2018_I69.chr2.g7442.t1.cds [Oikopleura dioica]|uniref:Oidioi.mRNA.OKI2018_I69.chr2.g7442.t1.cds n=1 Tax=Oikopleura dioica TaxID=34765 RepID=A0ABN7T673_OIKDI|nr:Oidioi.mRNA.OKI2018_I69.chr2.g7442.t1.cds [Oikopleura dioica]
MDFQGSNSFNIQTWNLEYWNFYRGNTFVVLHSKRSPEDLEDRFSKLIVVEGLNLQKYPIIQFYGGKVKNHNCFNGNVLSRNNIPQIGRSYEEILDRKKFRKRNLTKASVHNVVIRNNKLFVNPI